MRKVFFLVSPACVRDTELGDGTPCRLTRTDSLLIDRIRSRCYTVTAVTYICRAWVDKCPQERGSIHWREALAESIR